MVLVDTSVWIRFLANSAPYAAGLDDLLDRSEVVGHDLVYGELLIGDIGGRVELLRSLSEIPKLPAVPHEEVVEFVQARRLHGQGIGWIDAHLLASAIVSEAALWTADVRLAELASALGVGYRPFAN